MQEDRFGLPLTTNSVSAAKAYVEALDLLFSANSGAEVLLNRAIELDGDFALAHAAMARLKQMAMQGEQARNSAARARELMPGISQRECGHIEIISFAVAGQGAAAYERLERHLLQYPRDGLPLSLALGVYGLLGFSGRPDHHRTQRKLLESLAPDWGNDWWFTGYLGWSNIETGDAGPGLEMVSRSLTANPSNGNAAHAYAHGLYEIGDLPSGIRFLADWLPSYDRRSPLHCHLSWHHALLELERGNADEALAIYDGSIRPTAAHSSPMFTLVDCASFLWRGSMFGIGLSETDTKEAAEFALANFPHAGQAFVNVHTALALAVAGENTALSAHLEEVRQLVAEGRQPPGDVVATVCEGISAFAQADFDRAAELLGQSLSEIERIGGSHAQRDVVTETMIAAYVRAGRHDAADQEIERRTGRRAKHIDAAWLERLSP